ncbi:hypothetical protein LCGC14_0821300 [marine sediment metagenome]|uniref:Uncharacterized protein n=1 Tax=marine sediment metagenome TaxID=412755 RepID=A0A0F9Q412_9ZZZZ
MKATTPRPWTAKRCTHGWHIGPQPDGVCTIRDNTDGSNAAEQEANARLIAAAPELQAAAEAAIRYDESIAGRATRGEYDLSNRGGGITEGEDLDALYADWITKANAALAKAT